MTSTKLITSFQRRRRWSKDEKIKLVQETYESSVSSVARGKDILPAQLFYWIKCMENGALSAVDSEE